MFNKMMARVFFYNKVYLDALPAALRLLEAQGHSYKSPAHAYRVKFVPVAGDGGV